MVMIMVLLLLTTVQMLQPENIAPGSAFFVAAASDGATLTFNPAQRKTASALTNNDDFNTARANTSVERFDLVISDGDEF